MIRFLLLQAIFMLGGVFFSSLLFAQNDKYWVRFTDKVGTPYSTDEPLEFLSREAVKRRKDHDVPIGRKDLPVNPAYRDSVLAHPSVDLLHSSRWFNAITVHSSDSLYMDSIATMAFVKGSRKVKSLQLTPPDGPKKKGLIPEEREKSNYSGGSDKTAGKASRQLSMLGLDHLHALGYRGKGVRIAVLDAGFPGVRGLKAFDHIFDEGRYVAGFDAVEGDRSPFRAHPHGRSVLSILAAKKNPGFRGAAPAASYILCRTENAASERRVEEHNWIAAAEFADSAGADILTTSLGYTTFDDSSESYTPDQMDGNTAMITKGADIAASRGMLVVNSAGNYGASSWNIVGAPADGDSVMAVGSVDSSKVLSAFSSRGPTADGRIKPAVLAMGEGAAFLGGDGSIYRGNGTSFSAPLISGGAACLWSARPELAPMELFDLILANGSRHETPDNKRGHGIPDLYAAYLEQKGLSKVVEGPRRAIRVAPNPFSQEVEVHFFSGASAKVRFTWYDVLGRELASEQHRVDRDEHHELTLRPPVKNGIGSMFFLKVRWNDGPVRTFRLLHDKNE